MKVVVLGGVSYDYKISIDRLDNLTGDNMTVAKDVYDGIGSTGSGKSLALANLGIEVTLFALIGRDEYGKRIKEYFEDTEVDFIPIYCDKETLVHTNIMYENDKRFSIFHSIEPGNYKFPIDKLKEECKDADLLVVNIMGYARDHISEIKNINIKKFVDIHDYDGHNDYHKSFIDIADYLQYSKVNLSDESSFINELQENGHRYIVGTRSCDVMSLYCDNKIYEELTLPCDVTDSNGAGDSFSAGIIYGILNNMDPSTHLVIGRAMGYGACITKEIYNKDFNEEKLLNMTIKKDR